MKEVICPILPPFAALATMGVRGSPGEDPGWSKLSLPKTWRQAACGREGRRQAADPEH